jgi:hypothetical protein
LARLQEETRGVAPAAPALLLGCDASRVVVSGLAEQFGGVRLGEVIVQVRIHFLISNFRGSKL